LERGLVKGREGMYKPPNFAKIGDQIVGRFWPKSWVLPK
jgi:hypothetical protein